MTGNSRDSFARYREELDAMGFRPSSARGQNFLLDPTLHRYIAEAAAKSPEDVVLEIGVGLGFLTRELAVRSRRVIGVEIDDRLFEIAGRDLADHNNVRLICADALGGPSRTLHPAVMAILAEELQAGGAFVVAANLPYSISGPRLPPAARHPWPLSIFLISDAPCRPGNRKPVSSPDLASRRA